MGIDEDISSRLAALDVSLFDHISSQTKPGDRRSFLAVQNVVRRVAESYVYLEIGSHLGGSIQPHLIDPRCRKIFSIDLRPQRPADVRASAPEYPDNSTQRMLDCLSPLAPDQLGKIVCLDGDTRDLSPELITEPPDLCFIDGEHTDRAVLSDLSFCLSVCAENAVILFHDAFLIHVGIRQGIRDLRRRRRDIKGFRLHGSVFALVLGDTPLTGDPRIRSMAGSPALFFLLVRLTAAYRKVIPKSVREALKAPFAPLYRYFYRG